MYKQKNYMKEYHRSPKGKSVHKKASTKFLKTEKGKEYQRNTDLKKRYGITLEQYNEMLTKQEGKCAICGTDKPGVLGTWPIDHDHVTGKVRGLLCNLCNAGLGCFRDDKVRLLKSIEYLEISGS